MLIRALLLLAATALAMWPGWMRPDWDGTEGRRVQIALEMLRSGDWMVPTLGLEPTWAKPPLHYWLIALCAKWFGTGFVALRIPSVLAAFLSSFVGGELLRRQFGATTGWIGAFGLLLSPLVLFQWPTAEIDPLFATLTGLSLWLLAAGVARQHRGLLVWSGVAAGLAFLQKGPPFLLFALGAYLVWLRHRRMRGALWHFLPMVLVVAAYFAPLWLWFVEPADMLKVANEESVGRMALFEWKHVRETPVYWLRAALVLMPFGLWCFWEWRGPRDARMAADDLMLRMCSGGAVLAVVLLMFFPGRPTRYLLPNVMLFTFAVAPAVAHFFRHEGPVPGFARRAIDVIGVGGAIGLLVVPFVPRVGQAAVGLALALAVAPVLVRRPRDVVLVALLLPLVGAWTVGYERSARWLDGKRVRAPAGELLRRELDELGATEHVATYGHFESGVLLAADIWPHGDEFMRRPLTSEWVLYERISWLPETLPGYRERLRLVTPLKTLTLHERTSPK